MEHPSSGQGVEATVRRNPSDRSVTIQGRITALGAAPMTVEWSAAAPTTRGIGFAGAGQPYPSRAIAFENSPNSGRFESIDGSFTLQMKDIPAGYYSGLGSVYVPPLVEFIAKSTASPQKVATAVLWINDTAAPYRWLGGAPATLRPEPNTEKSTGRAMYYFGREELPLFENQEALLRAKAYPGDMTARGWPEPEDAKPWTHTPAPA
jgi:hypothetical protein